MVNNEVNPTYRNVAKAKFTQTLKARNQAIATLASPSISGIDRSMRSQLPSLLGSNILGIERSMRGQLPSLLRSNILGIERSMRSQLPSLLGPSILGSESLTRTVIPSLGSMEVLEWQRASSLLRAFESGQASFVSPNSALQTKRRRITSEVPACSASSGIEFRGSAGSRERRDVLVYFDIAVTNMKLRKLCRNLVATGHYSLAVEQAFKYVNNMVKVKSGLYDKDGADLMRRVFSENSPVLMLNSFQTESDKNEQQGYMHIYAGVMTGIRNPRTHQHETLDSPRDAVERLVIANHLLRILDSSTHSESE